MTPVHVLPVLSWKVYHITNFLKVGGYTMASYACDRQLYSHLISVLGKDYYIAVASFPGDRQLYSQFSIEYYHVTNSLLAR